MSESLQETDLLRQCRELAVRAKAASRKLAVTRGAIRNAWLSRAASAIRDHSPEILEANARDVDAAPGYGLNAAAIDRLRLNLKRIEEIARSIEEVVQLPDPVGEIVDGYRRPNGLDVCRVRVPIGVVLFLYESRPNVTVDAAALCVKSANAVILRGGKEALHSNRAFHRILAAELAPSGLPSDAVQLVQTTDRQAVGHLLGMGDQIDLAIPRGGESLIRRVVAEASMPVLKHYAGNCHIYLDAGCDEEMAVRIVLNAKVQRPGVCNAVETVLIHEAVGPTLLPRLAAALFAEGVELRGDERCRAMVPAIRPATPEDWDTEYLDKILAIKMVDSIDAAIDHIESHGSRHTEAIITRDERAAHRFVNEVDSSCVLVNASTRFNDGGQLGLGAEIGISTDKFHARGPCGLRELTSVKWIVHGDGQIRE